MGRMQETGPHIRYAGQDDLERLLDLYQHLVPGDERVSATRGATILQSVRRIDGSAIFVGEIGTTLVTSCTLLVVPNLTRGGRPYGLVENVVTHANYRNLGFGKLVLRAATDAAWVKGCYKVMLLTGSKSQATLNFYQEAGFEQSKTGFQMRRIPKRPSD